MICLLKTWPLISLVSVRAYERASGALILFGRAAFAGFQLVLFARCPTNDELALVASYLVAADAEA